MHPILRLVQKPERFVIGLMSGTSADGIDAAVVRLCPDKDDHIEIETLSFETVPYPDGLREEIFRISAPEHGRVDAICRINFLLGERFAGAAHTAARQAGLSLSDIDLIGSHGQTIHHLPERVEAFGVTIGATFQIGDPSVIAQRTCVVTVGDFRPADVAVGGQGAPLVPYVDYLLFRSPTLSRGLLNIGGIANMTVLPAGAGGPSVAAFDTGPGNMVIDAAALSLLGTPCDRDGRAARAGTPSETLVQRLLDLPFFDLPPPKSTGRELFGKDYATRLLSEGRSLGLSINDLLATATEITVRSIAHACRRFVTVSLDEVIVSGGGARNPYLMERLGRVFAPTTVVVSDERGLAADAKEAVAFAVLADRTIMGMPGNLPSATGADRPVVLGKICIP
ncbi:MAG: anhydro-N-acetylmuramic acid kinase [candidate division Zixibacteria bacterium]|nr:anhydro-N-acetylmuramic acid kinase [candidate division Zixibacteria bacterium]